MNNLPMGVRRVALAGAVIATLLLASCGGSDDNDGNNGNGNNGGTPPVSSNTPPSSASESSLGFIAYLKTVVVTQPVDTEPLDLTGFVAPLDDTSADPDLTI